MIEPAAPPPESYPLSKNAHESTHAQNRKAPIYNPQCDPTAPGLDLSSFTVCIFRSDKALSSTPPLGSADAGGSSLRFVGKGGLPVVDVRSTGDFRKAVAQTPDENYAWGIVGQLEIRRAGSYSLCIESDDG